MTTTYVAHLENQDLYLFNTSDPHGTPAREVHPVCGRADADRYLENNGYVVDGYDWRKVEGSKPAIWTRVVSL